MKTGKLDSPIVIDGTMKVVYDSGELVSAQTSITIPNLNGDVDGEYELICRIVAGADSNGLYIRPNNDTGNNYGYQYTQGADVTVSANRSISSSAIFLAITGASNTGHIQFVRIKINTKSGYVRTFIASLVEGINTTTINNVDSIGASWNNTIDNITSLVLFPNQTNGFGIGSRIILLKKVTSTGIKTGNLSVQGKIYGVWEEIYTNTLAAAATSVTISSLTGNTDVLYRLRARIINGYNGISNYFCRPNNISTADNYGFQYINAINVTVAAGRGTNTGFYLVGIGALGAIGFFDKIIFSKAGYVRTSISENSQEALDLMLIGSSWNNTSDEITSLVVLASQANGLGIGTNIVLERLNL